MVSYFVVHAIMARVIIKMKKYKIIVTYYQENTLSEEYLWAIKVNDAYVVDNIPFFSPNIAYQDLISVEQDEGVFYYDNLLQESGNSTIQVIFLVDKSKEREICLMKRLEAMSCLWEGFDGGKLYAVCVTKTTTYSHVKALLDQELSHGTLDYKEACVSNYHKNQLA